MSTEKRKAGMVVYRRVQPGEASTRVEVGGAPARLVDVPLDYLTLGKAVLRVVEEQAGRITELKQELADVWAEVKTEVEAVEHCKKMVAELQQRVNALNEQILTKDKRPVTLTDLQALRNGLPPRKEE